MEWKMESVDRPYRRWYYARKLQGAKEETVFNKEGLTPIKDRPRKGVREVWRYYDEYGEMKGRTCARCGVDKSTVDYYPARKTADGFMSYCKPCTNDYPNTRITRRK